MLTPLGPSDPRTLGRYRLHGRLGEGGMGVVYQAFGPDDQSVAIKMPRPAMAVDPEFRARFRREVSAARLVKGRFVAEVLDAQTDGNELWMATRYVDGAGLADAVHDRGRFEGPLLTALAVGLAEALVAIHAAGVVHRDLKPSNIIMAWDGPKIIDFGIASVSDTSAITRTGLSPMTAAWTAPEQLAGGRAGPPADIFSWACCIAFAASGLHPFRAETPAAIVGRILGGSPDLTGAPASLRPLLTTALARNPAARPTAAQLVSSLSGESVDGLAEAESVATRIVRGGFASAAPPSSPAATEATRPAVIPAAAPPPGPPAPPARPAAEQPWVAPEPGPSAGRPATAAGQKPVGGGTGSPGAAPASRRRGVSRWAKVLVPVAAVLAVALVVVLVESTGGSGTPGAAAASGSPPPTGPASSPAPNQVFLRDDFSNAGSAWQGGRYVNGTYQVSAQGTPNGAFPTAANVYPTAPASVRIDVVGHRAAGTTGSQYGLGCRADPTSGDAYLFVVTDREMAIVKYLPSRYGQTVLAEAAVPDLDLDAPNQLSAGCDGDGGGGAVRLTFSVNGHRMQADDSSDPLRSGTVLLVAAPPVENSGSPVDAEFDDVVVTRT